MKWAAIQAEWISSTRPRRSPFPLATLPLGLLPGPLAHPIEVQAKSESSRLTAMGIHFPRRQLAPRAHLLQVLHRPEFAVLRRREKLDPLCDRPRELLQM